MYSSVFSIFTKLCIHCHYLNSTFSPSHKKPYTPWQSLTVSFIPYSMATNNSVFCLYGSTCFGHFILMESYNTWRFSITFPRFSHVVACTSFLFMAEYYSSARHVPHFFFFFIYQLMDIRVVSTWWLLWNALQWTCIFRFLCEPMFSVLLGAYLGVELLGPMVSLCLTFWETIKFFQKW